MQIDLLKHIGDAPVPGQGSGRSGTAPRDVDPDHLTGCHASPVADCDRTWTTAHVVQDHIDQDAQ